MAFDGRRRYVYPLRIKGHFQNIRRVAFVLLQALLFVVPWLQLGGRPAFMVDLPGRQLFILGSVFTAADTVFLVVIGLGLAFGLFFVTSLFGRVWCGYACPQTVFLDGWVHNIERWIEGPRGKRMQLDRAPWGPGKIGKKVLKWAIFFALALVISLTTMSWFADTVALWTGQGSAVEYGFVAFFTAVMFADFAWFREQFCNYLCPYARFQGALADDHSLTITYDIPRGEPRHKGKQKDGEGLCISCNKCVSVCPAGIDIRDGFQLECISCARCIDACDSVMTRLGQETLVRYSTVAEDEGRPKRNARTRTMIYGGLLTVLSVAFLALLFTRHVVHATVARAPGSLFTVDDDGWTRNTYLLRVTNNHIGDGAEPFTVRVDGLADAQIVVPPVAVESTRSVTVPLVIRVPPVDGRPRTVPLTVWVASEFDTVELAATFKSGG